MIKCPVCFQKSTEYISQVSDDRYGYPGCFTINRCQKCGFGFTLPTLKNSKQSSLYTNYYPRKNYDLNTLTRIKEYFKYDWKKKFIIWYNGQSNICHYHTQKGDRVLDVGCGDGSSLLEIKKMGGFAFGTEQDKNVRKIAKEMKLRVYIGDLDMYPTKSKFDIICASQVIEHQSDPAKFIKDTNNLIKRKGKIILSFPNIDGIYQKISGKHWINWHVPYHQSYLTYESLKKITHQNKLVIEKWMTVTPTLWTIYQIFNLLPFTNNKKIEKLMWKGVGNQRRNDKIIFVKAIYKVFEILLWFIISPFNRLIDYFGMGDSTLVILRRKN